MVRILSKRGELPEIVVTQESDQVVQEEYAVDRVERVRLKTNPLDEKLGDDRQQPMDFLGICLQAHEELGLAQDVGSDVQRAPGGGEADEVARRFDRRSTSLHATDDKRKQAVRPAIRLS